ncbi:MAG: hypothetical protein ACOC56_07185 [Atribacterota bacterium]
MAKIKNNTINLGSSDTGVIAQGKIWVSGVILIASSDNPELVIKDKDGVEHIRMLTNITNQRYLAYAPATAFPITRPEITKNDNIERIIIHLSSGRS